MIRTGECSDIESLFTRARTKIGTRNSAPARCGSQGGSVRHPLYHTGTREGSRDPWIALMDQNPQDQGVSSWPKESRHGPSGAPFRKSTRDVQHLRAVAKRQTSDHRQEDGRCEKIFSGTPSFRPLRYPFRYIHALVIAILKTGSFRRCIQGFR